eukprot:gnl/Dysnectes_brevis/4742_a6518_602.p2 GENE.gnl/Dysnectes_brevis/4742_a6518_602~~gnl/Dysnectes_brevis/4742_a6518_602.p2  ORF type:complete len:106 (+),score=14.80 gnl/Dysnectes_brevis/4742_a6518_602:399-716(+)
MPGSSASWSISSLPLKNLEVIGAPDGFFIAGGARCLFDVSVSHPCAKTFIVKAEQQLSCTAAREKLKKDKYKTLLKRRITPTGVRTFSSPWSGRLTAPKGSMSVC